MFIQVSECVENFEYELALQYCETALMIAPSNVTVLETTGGLLLDFGDIERATQISYNNGAMFLISFLDYFLLFPHCS